VPRRIDEPASVALSLGLVLVLATGCSGASGRGQTADDEEYYEAPTDRRGPRDSSRTEPETPPVEPEATPEVPTVLVRRAPTSSGSLEGDAAGRAIFGIAGELGECYGAADGAESGRGVMYVLIDVEAGGEVGGVLIGHSEVRDLELMECVEERLGALTMPESEGSSVVQTHLVFGASDEDEGRAMLRAYRTARDEAAREADVPVPLTAVREGVEGCFERAFRGRGTEGGRLVLQLSVDAEGRVTAVEITEDEGTEGRLDSCVEDVVGKLRLAVEEGQGSTISYPVILQPARAAEPETPGEPSPAAAPTEEPAPEE